MSPDTNATKKQQGPHDEPKYGDLATWALVIVGIGGVLAALKTLAIIGRQTKAIEDQGAALVNAERAWIFVLLGEMPAYAPPEDRLEILYISPTVKNAGKTVGTIKLIKAGLKVLERQEELPPEPVYGEDMDTREYEIPIAPEMTFQPIKLGINGFDMKPILRSEKTLWVYGFVDYLTFGESHQVRFCYVYHIPGGFNPNPAGFYVSGPEAYNRAN